MVVFDNFGKKEFSPSVHGFKFHNRFSGVPFSNPKLSRINNFCHTYFLKKSFYGLCGGMCFSVLDYYYSDKPLPSFDAPPIPGNYLNSYIFKRQNNTYGSFGEIIAKFVSWSIKSDQVLQSLTFNEFLHIQQLLNRNELAVIGIVYIHISKSIAVWINHQVIAYKYAIESEKFLMYIYDPNFPMHDEFIFELIKTVHGFKCIQKNLRNNEVIPIRGFFGVPYSFNTPPDA